jgi:hypothetical protein
MVAVGLAAPAGMSTIKLTVVISAFTSLALLTVVVVFGVIQLVHGFRAMLDQGIDPEVSPSLWVKVPILTLIGIASVRLSHGLDHLFHAQFDPADTFFFMTVLVALQAIFGLLGYLVMKRVGYFETYLFGPKHSPGSYALICPGVAAYVFGMFFLTIALVKGGVIEKFSLTYFIVLGPLVVLQAKTIATMFQLDRKLLSDRSRPTQPEAAQTS